MFAWRVSAILAELERCLPENCRMLSELARDWEQLAGTAELAGRFARLDRISVDFGVMERARRVLMVEMDCCWLDLGSWSSLAGTREPDAQGNTCIAPQSLIVDGRGNIVVSESDHLVAIMGLNDLVVVHGRDATLICPREHEQKIKELTELRRKEFGERFE
jgi:mannose-1-phosphate guanylyltransferase